MSLLLKFDGLLCCGDCAKSFFCCCCCSDCILCELCGVPANDDDEPEDDEDDGCGDNCDIPGMSSLPLWLEGGMPPGIPCRR